MKNLIEEVKLRDHYFIAYLISNGFSYRIDENKNIWVNLSKFHLKEWLEKYEQSYKHILKEVRKIVKRLNIQTSPPLNTKNS